MNGLWKWPGSGGKWFKIQYSSHFLMHNYNLNNTFLNSEFLKISQLPKHISTSNIQWPNALSQPITKNQLSYHQDGIFFFGVGTGETISFAKNIVSLPIFMHFFKIHRTKPNSGNPLKNNKKSSLFNNSQISYKTRITHTTYRCCSYSLHHIPNLYKVSK
jgi:hypothetical protein